LDDVLVVRPGALGDTILTLPLLASLKSLHPRGRLTFLGTRAYAELRPPNVSYRPADGGEWVWLFAEAGSPPADLPEYRTAYLILNRPSPPAENLAGAGVKTIRHVGSRPEPGRHLVEHLHIGLGIPVPPPHPALEHLKPRERQKLIWIHPGSGGRRKCLPLNQMAALARRLQVAAGWDLVVTAGDEDAFLKDADAWDALISGPRTQFLENRPLGELCTELGSASLYVGNDSGISHLAAGLGIRSAVFFTDTDPAQWRPWVPPSMLRTVDLRGREVAQDMLERECLSLLEG